MNTSIQALASAYDEPPRQRRRVALPRGSVLRLDAARGACVRVSAGRVWLTEERRPHDVVLAKNDSHPIASRGRVIVAAQSPSRLLLEWPAAANAPRAEIAGREGGEGEPLPGLPRPSGRFAWLVALVAAWRAKAPTPHAGERNEFLPEAVRDRLAAHVPLLRC